MKKIRRILVIVVLVVIGILSVDIGYNEVYIPIQEAKEPLSILLVGADLSDDRDAMYGGTKDPFTDSLMVLTFNPNTYQFETTSIPRDSAVDYVCPSNPDSGLPSIRAQINHIYAASDNDIGCLRDSVSNLLNIPIDYYVKVNMDEVVTLVDLVGPLTITAHAKDGVITQDSTDVGNDGTTYTWVDQEVYQMGGQEALMYARARHDSEKDYGRGIRQQQVVGQLMNQIFATGLNFELIDQLLTLVETDMPYLLVYKYYEYAFDIKSNVATLADPNVSTLQSALPDSVWLDLFKEYNWPATVVDEKSITEFEAYLDTESINVGGYFITSHQFFNEKYDNYFNIVDEQLQTISTGLQDNLGLEVTGGSYPTLPYGSTSGYVNQGTYQGE